MAERSVNRVGAPGMYVARVKTNSAKSGVRTKEEAILEAATRVFLRLGYGRSSMDAIANEARVSKQTIYHHFGSKQALFGAIIRERCDRLLAYMPDIEAGDAEVGLTSLARQFLELVLASSSLALYRVLMAETTRFRELGQISYQSGPQVAVERLAAYLEDQTRRGKLIVSEPKLAAEQFFGMLTGHLQLRALLAVEERPPPDRIDRFIGNAIETFLKAYRPRG